MLTTVKKRPRYHEQIVEQVRQAIADGELKPGDKLSPRMLTDTFGVSKRTIIAAMRALVDAGLVVTKRGKETRIAGAVASG